jgi:hypothetical protein
LTKPGTDNEALEIDEITIQVEGQQAHSNAFHTEMDVSDITPGGHVLQPGK